MSYAIKIQPADIVVGGQFKVADYVSKSTVPEARERHYGRILPLTTHLWIEERWLEIIHGATGLTPEFFAQPSGLKLHLPRVINRNYIYLGSLVIRATDEGLIATVTSLYSRWDELVKSIDDSITLSVSPIGEAVSALPGNVDTINKIFGVEVTARVSDTKGISVEFTEEPGNCAQDSTWKVTSVKEIKPTQYATINKFNYGRLSLLGHVRQDAVRVDTGAPGRKAYMGSKDAIVRAIVDYRGAKLYVFNGEDKISHEEFLECVKMAGLDRVKDIEVWNNLNVKMVNDRLFFDGMRKSVKLHHEVDMEDFSERFTKNWFDTNYKEIYGFHSESIDRGTVRELRRLHGTQQAELREGAGYNGPHS